MGYSLAPILIIDAAWGLHNGVIAGTKSLVLLHQYLEVFLPIIAFALSISLSTLDREAFLGDAKYRRALAMIALLALFMVLLMFLMGAIISSAGKAGTEA